MMAKARKCLATFGQIQQKRIKGDEIRSGTCIVSLEWVGTGGWVLWFGLSNCVIFSNLT